MKIYRSWALALALIAMPGLVLAQTQAVPTAVGSDGRPRDVVPSAIMVAPAGGVAGKGTVLSKDHGLPLQGLDSVTNLPCTIGATTTCLMPSPGNGSTSFTPWTKDAAGSVILNVTTSTAAATALPGTGSTIWVINAGPNEADCLQGISSVQAVTTDNPVIPGNSIQLARGSSGFISCITPTGTATVKVLTGTGNPSPAATADFGQPVALAAGTALIGSAKISDGTNAAAVKAASTAPAATDPAVVVGISPNAGVKITDAGGTNQAAVKAASTGAATTDPAFVVAISPNPSPVCTSSIAVNQTASTDLVTSVAKLNICSIVLVSATAQNISLTEGTGSTCATGAAALIGGTTASVALVANGGIVAVADRTWLKSKVTADHLCLIQSGAGNISGVITYADAS